MHNSHRITLRNTVRQLVTLKVGGHQVTFKSQTYPRLHVVSIGMQGPVGTVAESVLTMAQEAKTAAEKAEATANTTMAEQNSMVKGMTLTLDHYIGAIGAQE